MTEAQNVESQGVGLVFLARKIEGDPTDLNPKVPNRVKVETPFSENLLLDENDVRILQTHLGLEVNPKIQLTLNEAINWAISFALQKSGIEIPENFQEIKKLNKQVAYTVREDGCYNFTYRGQELLELEQVNGHLKMVVCHP